MRIALAQVDLLVGDAEGNADRVLAVAERAAGADLILFPELTLAGYPPEDLLFHRGFRHRIEAALAHCASRQASAEAQPALLLGFPSVADASDCVAAIIAAVGLTDSAKGDLKQKVSKLGTNLIEAAACACPIVMGPHTFNFAEASQAAESAGAAQRASDMAAAMKLAADTVQNRPLQKQKSANAFQFAQQHGGATQRTVQAVLAQLKIKD